MKRSANAEWTVESLLELGRSYQAAAVLAAAADLDLFSVWDGTALTARDIARKRQCKLRGLVILLDALSALNLLHKKRDRYSLPAGVGAFMTPGGPKSILGMAQHQANCLRNWSQLARVIRTGRPAERAASVRGAKRDLEAFIEAMHNISDPAASQIIQAVRPLRFHHLLDIGGASGTWTMAFLRACPSATATLFDLPNVIPMARRRLAAAKLNKRVRFAGGDFLSDPLPAGCDLAWLGAIVHQNSREQNRHLFASVLQALSPGGRIVIRDLLMDRSRTQPVAGALFAVNMLVATEAGGTYTPDELREDMEAAGFRDVEVLRQDQSMNSLIAAHKPASNQPNAFAVTHE